MRASAGNDVSRLTSPDIDRCARGAMRAFTIVAPEFNVFEIQICCRDDVTIRNNQSRRGRRAVLGSVLETSRKTMMPSFPKRFVSPLILLASPLP
ncbi:MULTISPECIES: hypothetical protein [unclassified Bradyrhizobium]|uniref:hypothetical protein n=2 Tax=unclassified Bradyrhizobium TaxID=2631580 RepID=UPI0028EDB525|nr:MULTISPECIES: hypothetical protein [unclassified Bradyrhizobium]